MRLKSVKITNFRNFANFSIELDEQCIVIVGENNAGKTNFLQALRLVLDASLPRSARYLSASDFWSGLDKPFAGNEIKVTLEITDFANYEFQQAAFPECIEVSNDGVLSSVVSYIYAPRRSIDTNNPEELNEEDYDFYFCCNENPNRIITELPFQKYIPFEVLPALRNATADLGNRSSSPLRRLISRLLPEIDRAVLQELAEKVDKQIKNILELAPISNLQSEITDRITRMIGKKSEVIDPRLAFLQTDPERLLLFLRLFAEGGMRSLDEIGTGYANILYLVVLLLEARKREEAYEQATMVLAVEEPEAHLHPHLQRSIFRDLFSRVNENIPVLITTHSPHISSVAPLKSVVVLHRNLKTGETVGKNVIGSGLLDEELLDLERYIDVTRAEMIFSSRVLLVEGISEALLLTQFVKNMGLSLEEHGVSIVNIGNTNFEPYVKFLGVDGLDIRFAVITDGDPYKLEGSHTYSYAGIQRGIDLVRLSDPAEASYIEGRTVSEQFTDLADHGVFVGLHTLEVDLVDAGYESEYLNIFEELGQGARSIQNTKDVFADWKNLSPEEKDTKIVSKIENMCGKGRFAQKLAPRIKTSKFPGNFVSALKYLGVL